MIAHLEHKDSNKTKFKQKLSTNMCLLVPMHVFTRILVQSIHVYEGNDTYFSYGNAPNTCYKIT